LRLSWIRNLHSYPLAEIEGMNMGKPAATPWSVVDDGDSDFTGQYDVWIRAQLTEDVGLIVGAA
jgi:hypothetical protein